jgi:hypothetical protein
VRSKLATVPGELLNNLSNTLVRAHQAYDKVPGTVAHLRANNPSPSPVKGLQHLDPFQAGQALTLEGLHCSKLYNHAVILLHQGNLHDALHVTTAALK